MTQEIKLPPQPRPATGNPLSAVKVYGWDEMQDFARAAVALNAPAWQPIATAPRVPNKGALLCPRVLLLAQNGDVGIARWDDDKHVKKPKPRFLDDRAWLTKAYWIKNTPIAWMPLPAGREES